ncbi:MAG TPA: hypothetical protein VK722_06065 [Candidatus Aquilonibacter sp.]|jgi:hypothetical protein|nr:hypothetical protein [Candidatus Aquilonibacter sp.]
MKKFLAISLFALVSAGAYAATPTTDLTGKWTITWNKNGSPAKVSISDDNGNLSGTYTAESKETCSIDGVRLEEKLSIHLRCSQSDTDFDGSVANGTVSGAYTGYDMATGDPSVTGKFRMERSTPFLTQAALHQGNN